MEYKELIEQLKSMLPEKVLYGDLIGAEGVYAHSGPMVYEDPEPYFIEQAITAITDLLARAEAAEELAKRNGRDATAIDAIANYEHENNKNLRELLKAKEAENAALRKMQPVRLDDTSAQALGEANTCPCWENYDWEMYRDE